MLNKKHLAGRLLGAAILLLCGLSPAFGTHLKSLPGHVPKIISNLIAKGRLVATNELHLAIGLNLRDPAGLDDFLTRLYDPHSPDFHQFITPEAAAARFGPTPDDYEAVKNFARSNGLTVTTTYNHRLVLDVAGPAAAVEKAFHVTLRTYRHPTEARDFFAPDTEPTLDAQLPVADIQGLSDYSRPHPRLHRMNAARPNYGSSPDGFGAFFGNDFRNAYVPDTTLTGAGQSVGLFEVDGFYANDIAAYAAAAGNGRTNIVIQTVLLDSFNGVPTTNGNDEVSLDIEMAMAMAPGLTKIVVYEGNIKNYKPNDILSSMLSAASTVRNLGNSWGWNGGPSTTTDNIFKNMDAAGQSFFNASGDSEAYTGVNTVNGVDNPSQTHAPASNPYITQVGGTTLTMNGSGSTYASETVWNWGVEFDPKYVNGSSGGVSSSYSIPTWQTNVANLIGAGGSKTQRNIPDVAMTADDVYITTSNGTNTELGGTSCAAPLWAGFMALVNQQAAMNNNPVVGFVNPALYTIAAGTNYATCFHDITTGNNTWSNSLTLFYATNGYDLCTGLGTPRGQALINALANPPDPLMITPLAGTAAGVAGGPFPISFGNFQLTNSSSSSLAWSLVNTSSWLTVSPATGTLTAHAVANLTQSFTTIASNLVVGTYAANVAFSNQTSHIVQPGLFTLQVNQPLLVSPASGFTASGQVGGPFSFNSLGFVLTNQSVRSLAWNISNSPSWLSASPASGTLAGNTQITGTVNLTTTASNLAIGVYTANLFVTNFAGVAATLPFTINVGGSLVLNGGFETGNLTGWTFSGDGNNGVITSGSFIHSGNYGMALGQSGSLGFLSQTLATLPGQNYLLSLWFSNPINGTGAAPNQFVVQWAGTTLFNQANLPFTAWTNLQFAVMATSTNTLLRFGFEDTPYYLALDDISVVPFSLPDFKTAQAAQPATTNFNLTWVTTVGLTYQVQYATNLFHPLWINLGPPVMAGSNTLTMQDTNAFILAPNRFYRIAQH